MFFDRDLKGNALPPGTLCLTYDDGPGETAGDGPGPHTRQLGRYLAERGLAATFFVVGRHAEGHADLLHELHAEGHLVANHTYSHPGLVALATAGGDVVGEVARTHALIRDHVAGPVAFFRAPYGNWREKRAAEDPEDKATSIVAEQLNPSPELRNYVGPVNWDISVADYDFWRQGASGAPCAQAFLAKIARLRRGILLLHDSSEDEAVRARNQALQATQLLVPALQAQGYRFVRLDAIPSVQSALRVRDQVILGTPRGDFLIVRDGAALAFGSEGDPEVFGIIPLGGKRIALRASDGRYVSVLPDGGVFAHALALGECEAFALEKTGDGTLLRTAQGRYLARDPNDPGLLATAASARQAEPLALRPRFLTRLPSELTR